MHHIKRRDIECAEISGAVSFEDPVHVLWQFAPHGEGKRHPGRSLLLIFWEKQCEIDALRMELARKLKGDISVSVFGLDRR